MIAINTPLEKKNLCRVPHLFRTMQKVGNPFALSRAWPGSYNLPNVI
jgi:hypothetical protein